AFRSKATPQGGGQALQEPARQTPSTLRADPPRHGDTLHQAHPSTGVPASRTSATEERRMVVSSTVGCNRWRWRGIDGRQHRSTATGCATRWRHGTTTPNLGNETTK